MQRDLAGRDEIYLLTAHVSEDENAPLLATARRIVGPCRQLLRSPGSRDTTQLYHCARAERP
jgi:hypothetical protein